MVQLSKRLQMAARMVTRGNRVADIGCDHAHTSIYLVQQHISADVKAMDINQGPLERAAENVKLYGCEKEISVRLSDGAKELLPEEADTILISGMGGGLVIRILMESESLVNQMQELILQPQSEIPKVRKFLHSIGYSIAAEDMIFEGGKFYTAIRAIKGEESYTKEVYYEFGKLLLESKNYYLHEFLKTREEKFKRIIVDLKQTEYNRNKLRLKELEDEISLIREAFYFYSKEVV